MTVSGGTDPASVRRIAAILPFALYGMAAVFLLLAVVLLLVGRSAAADARLLAAEGVATEATVVNLKVTETQTRDMNDRRRTTTRHTVQLRFTSASGAEVTVDHPVSQARFDGLVVGDVVTIFHVPSRPTLVSFEKGDPEAGVGLFGVVAAIFGLVGIGIAFLGRSVRRKMAAA
jgi:hypothetical protein